MTNPAHLSGLVHLDNLIMTRRFSSIYLDCAKTNPTATLTATKPYRRALGCNNIFRAICPLAPGKVCGSTVTNSWFIGIKVFNQEGLSILCRKPAYASQATFLMTLNLISSGQLFFNLYLTRLAPMQACSWQ